MHPNGTRQLCRRQGALMECRRRRDANRVLLGVAGIVLTVLERSEGFSLYVGSTNSQSLCCGDILPRTSLRLVETEVPSPITEEPAVSTPFPSFVHNLTDNGDNSAPDRDVGDSDLLPPFFVAATTMIETPPCEGALAEEDLTTEFINGETEHVNEMDDEASQNENQSTGGSKGGSDKAKRLEHTAKANMLLSRRGSSTDRNSDFTAKTKPTSVGVRRGGNAAKARSNCRSVSRLADAIRTGTSIPAPMPANNSDEVTKTQNLSATNQQLSRNSGAFSNPSAGRAIIESTVYEMLKSSESKMGILGETVRSPRIAYRLEPGTVLIKSKRTLSSYATNSTSIHDVRVATTIDDLDIANLRLSVFSDFTPQTRKLFCDRSCHLIYTRRQRGAICIVATEPLQSVSSISPNEPDVIVGTAEISFHEFADTRLGRARPKNSILYVTEVAVNTKFRRKGIARLMMEAVDKVAKIRNAETIYLHVDVSNVGALRLYENAGFKKLPSDNPAYLEFTTKLNLHDGATKGRKHFLMSKDLKKPTWLEDVFKDEAIQVQTPKGILGIAVLP